MSIINSQVLFAIGLAMLEIHASMAADFIPISSAMVKAKKGSLVINKPGNYRLIDNITVTDLNKAVITITAENVTLDLNGYSILGPVRCQGDGTTRYLNTTCSISSVNPSIPVTGNETGIGIQVSSNSVVIRNGTVRGMGASGISINGNFLAVIDHVIAEENGGHGIDLYLGKLTNSVSRFNGGSGVHFCDCGGGGQSVITGNVIERNRQIGIRTGAGIVKDNFILYNGEQGVYVNGSGNNVANVVDNTVQFNVGQGIFSGAGGIYKGNLLTYNASVGGHQVTGVADAGGNTCTGGSC